MCLIAAVVVACGGSAGDEAAPPDPTPPPPAAQGFKLLPARLGLSVDDDGRLVALAPPGALVWSSSDPSVASVDTAGRVKALAKGSTVISAAAGNLVASSTLTVYRTAGANPDPSSEALIAQALAAQRISAEQALSYRVFAFFGDSRLPEEFNGAPSELPDHLLMRELSGRLSTLSQATQDLLLPFLIPPVYAQSGLVQAQSQSQTKANAMAAGRKTRADVTINCFFAQPQLGASRRATAHFNVHTVFSDDLLQGDDDRPTSETVSDFIVSVIEEVYQSETQLFKRFPLPDTREPCNGGDGALDIYVHPLAGRTKGVTVAYPGRCEKVPAYIVLNSNELFLSFGRAANSMPLAKKKKEWKSYIAHEFLHVLQFGIDRPAGCDDYKWLDEATATWVMDHVEPDANFEDGGLGIARSGQARRNGRFFANYLYNDHRVSIENASPESNPELNGYGDYLFFQYLARTYTPETIRQILDATEGQASVEAVASVLGSKGGMTAIWPEFAKTLWNDDAGQVLDDWSRWDHYDFGLAAIYSPTDVSRPTVASLKLKTLAVDQKGQPRASFKLLENALEFPGDFYEIQPRSMFYEHLAFTDPSVHSVSFFNPIAALPNREFMKVQAKKKIGGQWQEVEDWTDASHKQFCLDRKDERLEELLIIVSNSEVNRSAETPFKVAKQFPMLIGTSNVGCWKWQGTASVAQTGGSPTTVDSLARGSVTLEVAAVMPGRLVFETVAGVINGSSTAVLASCTTTLVGADLTAIKGAADGTLDVNLDLELGFGQIGAEPPDRKLLQLSGQSLLSTTHRMVCPDVDVGSVGPHSWSWLHVDEPAAYAVSADGQVIEGRFTTVTVTGVTINSVWKFTALRE